MPKEKWFWGWRQMVAKIKECLVEDILHNKAMGSSRKSIFVSPKALAGNAIEKHFSLIMEFLFSVIRVQMCCV